MAKRNKRNEDSKIHYNSKRTMMETTDTVTCVCKLCVNHVCWGLFIQKGTKYGTVFFFGLSLLVIESMFFVQTFSRKLINILAKTNFFIFFDNLMLFILLLECTVYFFLFWVNVMLVKHIATAYQKHWKQLAVTFSEEWRLLTLLIYLSIWSVRHQLQ